MTALIIAANAWVFLLELEGGDAFVDRWAVIPAQITSGHGWITIFTGMFMHAGWLHIIGNMIFLWAFGPAIEDAMGRFRYLVFYLMGGVVAMLAQVAGSPGSTVPCLGASGAIAAVMGAFIVTYPRDRIRTLVWILIIHPGDVYSGGGADRCVVSDSVVQRGIGGERADGRSGLPGACGRIFVWGGDGAAVEAEGSLATSY